MTYKVCDEPIVFKVEGCHGEAVNASDRRVGSITADHIRGSDFQHTIRVVGCAVSIGCRQRRNRAMVENAVGDGFCLFGSRLTETGLDTIHMLIQRRQGYDT